MKCYICLEKQACFTKEANGIKFCLCPNCYDLVEKNIEKIKEYTKEKKEC